MPISAIIFDIDGTLYPWNRIGIQLLGTFLLHLRFFKHFYEVRKELRRRGKVDDLRRVQAQLLAKALHVSEAKAEKKIDWFVGPRLNRACSRVTLHPFLDEFFTLISELKIKTAVLSDFPIGERLQSLGCSFLCKLAICSEDVNALKPSPEPFLFMTKKISCPPSEILYVGDNYHYDIVGAKRVGMQTAHLCKYPPPNSIATVSFSKYSDLGEWVRKQCPFPISQKKL